LEEVYKTRVTDLDKLKQWLRTEWDNYAYSWAMSSLQKPFVVDSPRAVLRVLYTVN